MMGRLVKATVMLGVALCSITGYSSTISDHDLFNQSWQQHNQRAPVVEGGYALIDDALARLIPMPYEIIVDELIPATMFLSWPSSDNWMRSLQLAAAPMGLEIRAHWASNRIVIARAALPAPASSSLVAAVSTAAVATTMATEASVAPSAQQAQPKVVVIDPTVRRGKFTVTTSIAPI